MKSPKLGKSRALKQVVEKLTDIRKKPVSKRVFEIVEENSKENEKSKKVANPRGDLEF